MTSGHSERAVVAACTAVAEAQLPFARVLADSYVRHHPGHSFTVVVLDAPPRRVEYLSDRVEIVGPGWLHVDPEEFLRAATAYGRDELLQIVKPWVLQRALVQGEAALWLDHVGWVRQPFGDLSRAIEDHGLVVIPRRLNPFPDDGREPSELQARDWGAFYTGLLGVSPAGSEFLDYWIRQLHDHGTVVGPVRSRHPINRLPGMFHHHVATDPGLGLAYWNAHERTADEAKFVVFPGFDLRRPWLLSTDFTARPRVLLSERPDVRRLVEAYQGELLDAAADTPGPRYGLGRFADGTRLTSVMRSLYRAAWADEADTIPGRAHQPAPPHPFGSDEGKAFRAWLAEPATVAQASRGLNRLALGVWAERPHLRAKYPDPFEEDLAEFRRWCRSKEGRKQIPSWAAPTELDPPLEPSSQFGVNFVGFLTAEVGLGELARLVHRSIQAAGIPIRALVEEDLIAGHCRIGIAWENDAGRPEFPITIYSINANYMKAMAGGDPELGHNRYRIGVWAWELEEFPESLHHAFEFVDEVWTISEFCREALAKVSPVPVRVIPMPVMAAELVRTARSNADDPTTFLFAFDFNSMAERKNPWGVVEAFRLAFPDRADVRLVIKANNGHQNGAARERLLRCIDNDPRIELLERYLSVEELDALYLESDAYVSLHRSEGFGLTVAEAMARGLPVIATDYSSTTEFVDARHGWPVPYRLINVGPGNAPYQADAHWAEPDIAAAAEAMRHVVTDPEEARRRGAAARADVRRARTIAITANWARGVLQEAHSAWLADATGRSKLPGPGADRIAGRIVVPRTLRYGVRRMGIRLSKLGEGEL